MKRFFIAALLFTASSLAAQRTFVVSEVSEQKLKYYFGMTTEEAVQVSAGQFPTVVLGIDHSRRSYMDSATGKRSGTIIIESRFAPVEFGNKRMKLELSFLFDTLRSAAVTLIDAKRCEIPYDNSCLRDTSSDYKLVGYMRTLFDTTRSVASSSPGETNIFHITRMNKFTQIEEVDDDGRWHDLMRVDKRFVARILTHRNGTTNTIKELPVDLAPGEQGIITCSCGEGLPTDDHAALAP